MMMTGSQSSPATLAVSEDTHSTSAGATRTGFQSYFATVRVVGTPGFARRQAEGVGRGLVEEEEEEEAVEAEEAEAEEMEEEEEEMEEEEEEEEGNKNRSKCP